MGGASHGGTAVDLDEPRLEVVLVAGAVAADHEVGAVQLERVLALLDYVLRAEHGANDGVLHARIDDALPRVPLTLVAAIQVLVDELAARPHVLLGQLVAALRVVLVLLLYGVVAQMRAGARRVERELLRAESQVAVLVHPNGQRVEVGHQEPRIMN